MNTEKACKQINKAFGWVKTHRLATTGAMVLVIAISMSIGALAASMEGKQIRKAIPDQNANEMTTTTVTMAESLPEPEISEEEEKKRTTETSVAEMENPKSPKEESVTEKKVTTILPKVIIPELEQPTATGEAEYELVAYEEATLDSAYDDSIGITYEEWSRLCNLVNREYGSDWVPESEKAKVVACVMNRVISPQFPNTIDLVLNQENQFSDSNNPIVNYTLDYDVTESVKASVNYYFHNIYDPSFEGITSYYGDGTYNYFS